MATRSSLARRVGRQLKARVRLALAALTGLLIGLVVPAHIADDWATRLLLGWNCGVLAYLVMLFIVIRRALPDHLRQHAREQDEGRAFVLAAAVVATVTCLVAIFAELASVKHITAAARPFYIGLTALTIASSWLFIHAMFAMHYAHGFYLDRDAGGSGGLDFPGTQEPGYTDFLYFAAIIGTSGQTADVAFTHADPRRIGLFHCVLAYAFNTTVLALCINIASSLL